MRSIYKDMFVLVINFAYHSKCQQGSMDDFQLDADLYQNSGRRALSKP
jgi:hypothetical protein